MHLVILRVMSCDQDEEGEIDSYDADLPVCLEVVVHRSTHILVSYSALEDMEKKQTQKDSKFYSVI